MAVIDSATVLVQAKNYSGSGDWLDESGNGHDFTPVNSPVHNGDHFALTAASSQYFFTADHANLDFADGVDFTIMIVASVADAGGGTYTLVSKRSAFAATDVGYMVYNSGFFGQSINGEIADGTSETNDVSPAVVDDTKFVYALRRDDTTPELEAFIDGTGSGSPSTTDIGDLSNGLELLLGARGDHPTGDANHLEGKIYAFALWRSVLSDADIATAGNELTASSNLLLLGVG